MAVLTDRPDRRVQNTATRQLCAGAHLDRTFRDWVVHEVYLDSKHRVAPSYGFDIVPVVVQAWRAWILETVCRLGLLGAVLAGLVVDAHATVLAVCLTAGLVLVGTAIRYGWRASRLGGRELRHRLLRSRHAGTAEPERREHARRLTLSVVGVLAVVLAAVGSAVVGGRSIVAALPGALIVQVAVVGLAMGAAAARQWSINSLHRRDAPRPAELGRRLATIDAQQNSTLVVYRRRPHGHPDQWPFVGSGTFVYRFPQYTIHLAPAKQSAAPVTLTKDDAPAPASSTRFTTYDFVKVLKDKAAELYRSADAPALPGLSLRDRLFVEEEDIAPARPYLDRAPTELELKRIINNPWHDVSHYLEIGETQTGEVVVTVFVRPTVQSGSLNLDIAVGVLTRPPHEYGVVDAYREVGTGAVLRAMVRAVRDLPGVLGQSWRLVEAPVVLVRAVLARTDHTLRRKRGRPVGTRVSIRQDAVWLSLRSDVKLDLPRVDAHKNMILQPLLNATTDFLEERGIDVSSLKQQALYIINTSVVTAGVINNNQGTIGTNGAVTNTGYPAVGQPGVGQPGVGQPGVGQPGVGQPGVGQPAQGGGR